MPIYHEQQLVDLYFKLAKGHADDDIAVETTINTSCKAKKYADVEYISKSGIHWALEAKTHESPDFGNAVHKIFGELMKETGRTGRPDDVRYGLLLPGSGLEAFGKSIAVVNKTKFEEFGKLIPISDVIYIEDKNIFKISWGRLHGYKKAVVL